MGGRQVLYRLANRCTKSFELVAMKARQICNLNRATAVQDRREFPRHSEFQGCERRYSFPRGFPQPVFRGPHVPRNPGFDGTVGADPPLQQMRGLKLDRGLRREPEREHTESWPAHARGIAAKGLTAPEAPPDSAKGPMQRRNSRRCAMSQATPGIRTAMPGSQTAGRSRRTPDHHTVRNGTYTESACSCPTIRHQLAHRKFRRTGQVRSNLPSARPRQKTPFIS